MLSRRSTTLSIRNGKVPARTRDGRATLRRSRARRGLSGPLPYPPAGFDPQKCLRRAIWRRRVGACTNLGSLDRRLWRLAVSAVSGGSRRRDLTPRSHPPYHLARGELIRRNISVPQWGGR